jgi:chemotaxis signal transduction protein
MSVSAAVDQKGVPRVRVKESAILFTISGYPFAIASSAVHEIRSADSLAGSAMEIEQSGVTKVKHLVHRGNRSYFVVNGCAHFGLKTARPTLVLILRDSPVAILVDKIERMADINAPQPLPLAFEGEERRWYRGLSPTDDVIVPVVNPAGFLTRHELRALEEALHASRAEAHAELSGTVAP